MGRRGAVSTVGSAYPDVAPLLVPVPAAGTGNATLQEAINSLKRSALVTLRAAVPSAAGVNPYVHASAASIILPDSAKAAITSNDGKIDSPWGRANTGGVALGVMVIGATGNALPSTRNIAIAPNGDLILLGTDGWTSVDYKYFPFRVDVVEATYPVTPGTGVVSGLPSGLVLVMEAEILVGGTTGKCVVQLPAATAPTTRLCNFNLPKTGVFFCIADAVTSARLKLGVIPSETY